MVSSSGGLWRGVDALSQLGLVTRREVEMKSEEGETVRRLQALQEALPPSEAHAKCR
jgi:hypothetical protein